MKLRSCRLGQPVSAVRGSKINNAVQGSVGTSDSPLWIHVYKDPGHIKYRFWALTKRKRNEDFCFKNGMVKISFKKKVATITQPWMSIWVDVNFVSESQILFVRFNPLKEMIISKLGRQAVLNIGKSVYSLFFNAHILVRYIFETWSVTVVCKRVKRRANK